MTAPTPAGSACDIAALAEEAPAPNVCPSCALGHHDHLCTGDLAPCQCAEHHHKETTS